MQSSDSLISARPTDVATSLILLVECNVTACALVCNCQSTHTVAGIRRRMNTNAATSASVKFVDSQLLTLLIQILNCIYSTLGVICTLHSPHHNTSGALIVQPHNHNRDLGSNVRMHSPLCTYALSSE